MQFLKISLIFFLLSTFSIAQSIFGDTLYSFNAGVLTPTGDYSLSGIEFVENHFWITGFNAPIYDHRIYKINAEGDSLIDFYVEGQQYHARSDMTYDGEYLYIVDKDSVLEFDPAAMDFTGNGFEVPVGIYLLTGIAYDPNSDNFWVIPTRNGQTQIIYEVDRSGNILNSYANKPTDYTTALALDTVSVGGPYLWTSSREEIGFDSRSLFRQFNIATGEFTGVTIEMVNRSPYTLDNILGFAITNELVPGKQTIVSLQAGNIYANDGMDWVVIYDADPDSSGYIGPEISVEPTSIETQLVFGDTIDAEVYISNNGQSDLSWRTYIENPDAFLSGELGDTLRTISLNDVLNNSDISFSGLEFARDHIWVTGRIFPDTLKLYQFDKFGNLVKEFPYFSSLSSGWRNLATDGDFLYATDQYAIRIWSIDDSTVTGFIPLHGSSPSAITLDPNTKEFYLGGGSTDAIKVIDMNGDEVNFLITNYNNIEGLAWDNYSPDGPFLWAFVENADSSSSVIRLNPWTAASTGVSFTSFQPEGEFTYPEAGTISIDFEEGKLSFIGLQKNNNYQNRQDFIVGYDLNEIPPPSWLRLLHPTYGTVEPGGVDTLSVRLMAMMEDTTTSAVIRINNNDVFNPLVKIPVIIDIQSSAITGIGNDLTKPEEYFLEQNYPNPFNPSTIIRYSIRDAGNVQIKLYDMLGREVKTLVNEFKPAGNYVVNLNAAGFASGIYFYTLISGNYSETKKMVLTK